jgi:SAM-dependent methyltransferase
VQRLPFAQWAGALDFFDLFDLAVCHNSFPRFVDMPSALRELARVLAPGSRLPIQHDLLPLLRHFEEGPFSAQDDAHAPTLGAVGVAVPLLLLYALSVNGAPRWKHSCQSSGWPGVRCSPNSPATFAAHPPDFIWFRANGSHQRAAADWAADLDLSPCAMRTMEGERRCQWLRNCELS